ncbi:DUF1707 domain-containing protein [Nakamurella sp. PAMC28650]|uniref:DUF1707 SHOCT-like domain-containing protein n=1 Tax=Nakamurella sp. PAMC28650 TaxID=2762325 RepID=UPI001C9AE29F|nr:DUF1707 domain-containing protein [Nakamurella sp. PAMC28650]
MTNDESAAPGGVPTDVRVGDAERNSAVTALGDHMASGRLDLDEYGSRSAVAGAARTAGELQALFADLPAPHPVLPGTQSVSIAKADGPMAAQTRAGATPPWSTTAAGRRSWWPPRPPVRRSLPWCCSWSPVSGGGSC